MNWGPRILNKRNDQNAASHDEQKDRRAYNRSTKQSKQKRTKEGKKKKKVIQMSKKYVDYPAPPSGYSAKSGSLHCIELIASCWITVDATLKLTLRYEMQSDSISTHKLGVAIDYWLE